MLLILKISQPFLGGECGLLDPHLLDRADRIFFRHAYAPDRAGLACLLAYELAALSRHGGCGIIAADTRIYLDRRGCGRQVPQAQLAFDDMPDECVVIRCEEVS